MDISLAAYYLKKVPISFEEYIKNAHKNAGKLNSNNMTNQSHNVDFSYSRRALIHASIAKVIEKNPEFKNIIFLISLLDPHDIPTNLLGVYKDPILVGQLLHELETYSLITKHICSKNPYYPSLF